MNVLWSVYVEEFAYLISDDNVAGFDDHLSSSDLQTWRRNWGNRSVCNSDCHVVHITSWTSASIWVSHIYCKDYTKIRAVYIRRSPSCSPQVGRRPVRRSSERCGPCCFKSGSVCCVYRSVGIHQADQTIETNTFVRIGTRVPSTYDDSDSIYSRARWYRKTKVACLQVVRVCAVRCGCPRKISVICGYVSGVRPDVGRNRRVGIVVHACTWKCRTRRRCVN